MTPCKLERFKTRRHYPFTVRSKQTAITATVARNCPFLTKAVRQTGLLTCTCSRHKVLKQRERTKKDGLLKLLIPQLEGTGRVNKTHLWFKIGLISCLPRGRCDIPKFE